MELLLLIALFCLFLPFFKKKKQKRTKACSPDLPQRKKPPEDKIHVTVTFEAPKPADDYKYPWDERRPSSNTDFSNANFLACFKTIHPVSDDPDVFGRFVSYRLHIYDPIKRRDELIESGFLRFTVPAETLTTYKVVELKEILKANALPATGKKAELISRIVLSVDLERLKLPRMCCLSDKGIGFINQNQDMITLAGNPYGVTYEEYMAAKKGKTHTNYNEIIWSVFVRRELQPDDNYGARIWNVNCCARFLLAENRPVGALEHFIRELYLRMNDPIRVVSDSIKRNYSDDELQPMQLPPDLIISIFDLKEHYSIKMFERCYSRIDVPKILIQRSMFERLINDIFDGIEIDVSNYLPKGLR